MLRAMFVAILAIGLFSPVCADEFDDVRREAQAAYAELDSAVAEREAQHQAKFRLLVKRELTVLDLELRRAHGNSLADSIMGLVNEYTDQLLADDAGLLAKMMGFNDFITRTRVIAGLTGFVSPPVEIEAEPREPYEELFPSGPEEEIGEEQENRSSVPSAHFTSAEQIFQARDEANWAENIQEATRAEKRGWSRLLFWRKAKPTWPTRAGQVWTSADGKVTFAVGVGEGMMGQMVAEMTARDALVRIGRESARFVVAELVGTAPVGFYERKNGIILCLMAVPTELLPKVER